MPPNLWAKNSFLCVSLRQFTSGKVKIAEIVHFLPVLRKNIGIHKLNAWFLHTMRPTTRKWQLHIQYRRSASIGWLQTVRWANNWETTIGYSVREKGIPWIIVDCPMANNWETNNCILSVKETHHLNECKPYWQLRVCKKNTERNPWMMVDQPIRQ